MENKAGILYNDHRTPIERDVAQLGSAFCFGYKMSRVPILSFLPITSPLGSNEGSIEIDSNWTYKIFHLMRLYACKMYWG